MSLSVFYLLVQFVNLIPYMSEIIWYLSFADWLISHSIMFSRSIHTVAKGKIFFFFFKDFIYLFLERGREAEREGEKKAMCLAGNCTGGLLLCGKMPNQLSHTSRGYNSSSSGSSLQHMNTTHPYDGTHFPKYLSEYCTITFMTNVNYYLIHICIYLHFGATYLRDLRFKYWKLN